MKNASRGPSDRSYSGSVVAPDRKMRFAIAVAVVALGVSPALAAPTDPVRSRVAGYRELGTSFKALNDALRRGSGEAGALGQAAARIRAASRAQYGWFPKGSGPRPGVKTAAKPAIWSDPAKFRNAQDAFAGAAQALEQVARSGDAAAVKAQARKVGAACKGCHDVFRVESE